MKVTKTCRQLLPGLAFACAAGVASLASAQTSASATSSTAPAGVMAPVATLKPTPAANMTPEAKPAATRLAKSEEFSTVALATAHCPGDTVVWSSLSKSHSYHLASSKLYGKTKHGAYVCKADAASAGLHLAKD